MCHRMRLRREAPYIQTPTWILRHSRHSEQGHPRGPSLGRLKKQKKKYSYCAVPWVLYYLWVVCGGCTVYGLSTVPVLWVIHYEDSVCGLCIVWYSSLRVVSEV